MKSQWNFRHHLRHMHKHYSTAHKPSLIREKWQPVIGLEIHAQISSASKLFSRVKTKYGAPPNTQVGIFESAHPGTLPVLNKRCVEAAVKTALALNATVNKVSSFDRKHYFYPDLPAGYQITQLDHPIASKGYLEFVVYNAGVHHRPYYHSVDLVQIQLEEDSGKSIHDTDNNRILVDLNRAGQPLMELVFAPGLRDAEEAAALVKDLALLLQGLGTCNARMDEGSLRVDANVSVHQPGKPFGTRTEIKNLNSLRSMVRAIDFEIERQIEILETGGTVDNETRSFDSITRTTESMRDKEVLQDYRFMPEPNLPPLRLYDSDELDFDRKCKGSMDIAMIRQMQPELPEETRQKLVEQYHTTLENAILLVSEVSLLNFFVEVMNVKSRDCRLVCSLLFTHLLGILHQVNLTIDVSPVSASVFGEIVDLQQSGVTLLDTSQKILEAIILEKNLRSPVQIVEMNNWQKITDESMVEDLCHKVLMDNSSLVDKYRGAGAKKKKKFFNAIMGKIREAADSRADMSSVEEFVKTKLESN